MATDPHLALVERNAALLCASIKSANAAGVSDALLLPALISVFREAGLFPADLDLGSLFALIR